MRIQLCLCNLAVTHSILSRYIVRIIALSSCIGNTDGRLGIGRGSYLSRNSASISEAIEVLLGSFPCDDLLVDTLGTVGWAVVGSIAASLGRPSTPDGRRNMGSLTLKDCILDIWKSGIGEVGMS